MGWTSLHRQRGISNADWVEQELLDNTKHKIVAHHSDGWTAFYAAVENRDDHRVWALVLLTDWNPGYYNFTYKCLDETVGPVESRAPAKVLDALTPTDSQYALEWRQRCRSRLARLETNKRELVDGCTLTFPGEPLRFSNGIATRSLIYRRRGRRSGLYLPTGQRVSIPHWREWNFTITPPTTPTEKEHAA